ncbi:zinc-dependent metalloprotease [uncultured Actinomyces sp.]|uniref:zinc-dependent metalloprotease n=1 Tax=uncultured Actinomyces sp. TaxID=249061 RepID=UPI0028DCAA03|nr:zinc-dependent metalloprotease [uncultured Actinomyces sp.]
MTESTGIPPASSAADLVDWRTATTLARLGTPAGPVVPAPVRRSTVELLRRSAIEAPAWVGRITGLRRAAQLAADRTEVLVVDRAGLQRASAEALQGVLTRVDAPCLSGRLARAGCLPATVQLAGALGAVSTRLLGQVVPVMAGQRPAAGRRRPGPATAKALVTSRILLVAPNVLALQRRLDLDLLDLPAWICLHETAHAVQLAVAPWLAEQIVSDLAAVLGAVSQVGTSQAASPAGTTGQAADQASGQVGTSQAASPAGTTGQASGQVSSDHGGAEPGPSPVSTVLGRLTRIAAVARLDGPTPARLGGVLSEEGRERLARLVATLTFLEGHAEVVLDAVEPAQMPSVYRLRSLLAHSRRREQGVGPGLGLGSLIYRLAGLEAKRAQYATGAAFARAVVERVGHTGLNAAWAGPEMMPRSEELEHPRAWMDRVLG